MDVLEYIKEFRDVVGDTACEAASGCVPRCVATHYRALAAACGCPVVGELYVCHAAAVAGVLGPEAASAARVVLASLGSDALESAAAAAPSRATPERDCYFGNRGLELYAGCITGPKIMHGARMRRCDDILSDPSVQWSEGGDGAHQEVGYSNIGGRGRYSFVAASVGNFVDIVGDCETRKSPVVVKLCRDVAASWLEYVGRDGKLYRFSGPILDSTLNRPGPSLARMIVMDALKREVTRHDSARAIEYTTPNMACQYAINCATDLARMFSQTRDNYLVCAVPPCMTCPDSLAVANGVIVDSCVSSILNRARGLPGRNGAMAP